MGIGDEERLPFSVEASLKLGAETKTSFGESGLKTERNGIG